MSGYRQLSKLDEKLDDLTVQNSELLNLDISKSVDTISDSNGSKLQNTSNSLQLLENKRFYEARVTVEASFQYATAKEAAASINALIAKDKSTLKVLPDSSISGAVSSYFFKNNKNYTVELTTTLRNGHIKSITAPLEQSESTLKINHEFASIHDAVKFMGDLYKALPQKNQDNFFEFKVKDSSSAKFKPNRIQTGEDLTAAIFKQINNCVAETKTCVKETSDLVKKGDVLYEISLDDRLDAAGLSNSPTVLSVEDIKSGFAASGSLTNKALMQNHDEPKKFKGLH